MTGGRVWNGIGSGDGREKGLCSVWGMKSRMEKGGLCNGYWGNEEKDGRGDDDCVMGGREDEWEGRIGINVGGGPVGCLAQA